MYDLIILGGGPAGLTAIIYALRKRLNVLLITNDLGGKTNYGLQLPDLEHHLVINGEEIINRFANEIEHVGFAHVIDKALSVERLPDGYRVHTQKGEEYSTRALILATGAKPRKLDVPGEQEFMMRGLCYSAISYAPLFIDRRTVVIGDTDRALRSTMELAQIAKEVTLIMPAPGELDIHLSRRLQTTPNVILMEDYQVERVEGDQYARHLIVRKGRDVREVRADAFFVEFDFLPNSAFVFGLVERDTKGRIKIDAHNRTSAPGVFAAGDVTDAYAEQVLIAIGEGAKAALSVHEYLLKHPVERLTVESVEVAEWR